MKKIVKVLGARPQFIKASVVSHAITQAPGLPEVLVHTRRMLTEVERVLFVEKPDIALVYCDTNSTLAGALAAIKLHIPVAHVEAGLRSFNMAMPEEVNRTLTDRISRWLFAPTQTAVDNLICEDSRPKSIHLV